MSRPRMIIDCDPGHDDALALLLASHVAEVVGVTTVSGNAPLAEVTRNAQSLVQLLAADIPVHAGAQRALAAGAGEEGRHATHVHGSSGMDGVTLPEVSVAAPQDAVPFLLETTRAEPGLWLVAIGPLTNVALAILEDADFVGRLAGISIMGGSTRGGNVTAAAEFNIWADPEAADMVFRAGAKIRLCGLNLTHQLKTSAPLLEQIRRLDSRPARLAAEVIEYLHGRMQELTGEAAAALHDPCAVLAVTHPQLFEFVPRPVGVALEDPLTRGMTVVDERYAGRNSPNQVEVAYRIDSARAFELLLAALAGEPGA